MEGFVENWILIYWTRLSIIWSVAKGGGKPSLKHWQISLSIVYKHKTRGVCNTYRNDFCTGISLSLFPLVAVCLFIFDTSTKCHTGASHSVPTSPQLLYWAEIFVLIWKWKTTNLEISVATDWNEWHMHLV